MGEAQDRELLLLDEAFQTKKEVELDWAEEQAMGGEVFSLDEDFLREEQGAIVLDRAREIEYALRRFLIAKTNDIDWTRPERETAPDDKLFRWTGPFE